MKNELKELLAKMAEYAPIATPYVGAIYSQFLADKANAELKLLLNQIIAISQEEAKGLKVSNSELQEIKEAINYFISSRSSRDKITVIVPAGGDGGSLFPVTQVMPKCLVTIGSKSILQHIIDPFYYNSDLFDKVIVMTNKYSIAIEENVKQGGYGDFVECKTISSNTLPEGLLKLKDHLEEKLFLLHFNDILIEECDWEDIHSRYFEYRKRKKHIGMLLCSKYYPSPLGIGVIKEGRTDTLASFIEKPDQLVGDNLANLAVAIFEPELFNYMENGHKGLFEDTIGSVVTAKRPISLYRIDKWHHVQDLKELFYLQNEADLGFLTNKVRLCERSEPQSEPFVGRARLEWW